MTFDDRTTDDAFAARSLSEQLRDLEVQLGPDPALETDLSLPRGAWLKRLPTHLGRPIGLTQPEGFPRIALLDAAPDTKNLQSAPPLSPTAAFRRGATMVGAGLLLLAMTAIVPPLFLRHPLTAATQPPILDQVAIPQRTERFAQSAQELRHAGPGTVSYSTRTEPAPVWTVITPAPVAPRPTAHFEPTAAEGEAAPDPIILLPPPTR